jgi:hypothetical protein
MSGCNNYCADRYKPLYMSYEEFRKPIKLEEPKEIEKSGKIYVYQNLLFINEPRIGVHIFDNSNPKEPKNIGFLKVVGNIDIAVKDGFLYLDSLVDLVIVDINNTNDIKEVGRVKDIIPYNYRDVTGVRFSSEDIDESKGVIIGYKEVLDGSCDFY